MLSKVLGKSTESGSRESRRSRPILWKMLRAYYYRRFPCLQDRWLTLNRGASLELTALWVWPMTICPSTNTQLHITGSFTTIQQRLCTLRPKQFVWTMFWCLLISDIKMTPCNNDCLLKICILTRSLFCSIGKLVPNCTRMWRSSLPTVQFGAQSRTPGAGSGTTNTTADGSSTKRPDFTAWLKNLLLNNEI